MNGFARKEGWDPGHRAKSASAHGFTILELLVATAILALVLGLLLQIVNGLLQSTRTQNQQISSIASARRALDVMAADLKNGVVGENAAILAPVGNSNSNLLSLVTHRRGPNGSNASHRFLAVSYSTNDSGQLFRSYGSVNFSQTNLLAAATNTSTPLEPLAGGILAFQIHAVTDTANFPVGTAAFANWATNNYNGIATPAGFQALITRSPTFASALTNRSRALEIWVAAADQQNYDVLAGLGKLATVRDAMGTEPAAWRQEIDAAPIPSQSKAGIRILSKTIPLP